MKFEQSKDFSKNSQIYTLELDGFEVATLKLDESEKALLYECEKSRKISDKLLALEMIVRKLEEDDKGKRKSKRKLIKKMVKQIKRLWGDEKMIKVITKPQEKLWKKEYQRLIKLIKEKEIIPDNRLIVADFDGVLNYIRIDLLPVSGDVLEENLEVL